MEFNVNAYNSDIQAWSKETLMLMKGRLALLGVSGKQQLLSKVKSQKAMASLQQRVSKEGITAKDVREGKKYRMFGEIVGFGFSLTKQGVMISKGAGRGHKVGNPRDKKDWFNQVIDARFSALADIVAKHKADKAVDATEIKIK